MLYNDSMNSIINNKSKIKTLAFVAMIIFIAIGILCACTFSLAQVSPFQQVASLGGVSFDSASSGDFFKSQDYIRADKNEKYNVIVQFNEESVFEYMQRTGFSGSFQEFLMTTEADIKTQEIVALQEAFFDKVKTFSKDAICEDSLLSSVNCMIINLPLKNVATLVAMAEVRSIDFETEFFIPQGEEQQYLDYSDMLASGQTAKSNSIKSEISVVPNNTFVFNNETSYKGEKMLVAVIDSSLNDKHSAFSVLPAPNTSKYENDSLLADLYKSTNAFKEKPLSNEYFKSTKIPFAYDYGQDDFDVTSSSNHGTHVSGILAGNDGNGFVGVVPNAQLMFCKVSNSNGQMSDSDIVRAMEDCLILGAEVVNMSLGSLAGFDSEDSKSYENTIYKVLNNLEESGANVAIAAGNEGTSTKKNDGTGKASVANPDNGMMGSPASYPNSIAVANYDGKITGDIALTSSRGVTNHLLLKPDIAGYGTSVKSAYNAGYGVMTGTSMASPNVAGVYAAIMQMCKAKIKAADPSITVKDLQTKASEMSVNLLMSTADVESSDTVQDSDNLFIDISPRAQGAGLANVSKAIMSKAYLKTTNNGYPNATIYGQSLAKFLDNRPKLQIGDDAEKSGSYTLEFEVVNYSNDALSYSLDLSALTEKMDETAEGVFTKMNGTSRKLSPSFVATVGGALIANGMTFNVAGGETKNIQVVVTLSDEDKAYLNKCPNGMYVDGFVKLNCTSDGGGGDIADSNLSIPFLTFYGSWTNVPMLDLTYYDSHNTGVAPQMSASALYGQYGTKNAVLGDYLFEMAAGNAKVVIGEDKAAISTATGGINSISTVQLGLLRNAEYVDLKVLNSAGETIIQYNDQGYFSKVVYDGSAHNVLQKIALTINLSASNAKFTEGERYTLVATPYLSKNDFDNKKTIDAASIFKNDFWIDSTAPTASSILVSDPIYNKIKLKVSVTDSRFTQAIVLCNGEVNSSDIVNLTPRLNLPSYQKEAGETWENNISLELALGEATTLVGNNLYIYVVDYAMNGRAYKILDDGTLSQVNGVLKDAPLSFTKSICEVLVGSEINLNTLLIGTKGKTLSWTSDNLSVATVSSFGTNQGVLNALKDGNATITVRSRDTTETASIVINVVHKLAEPVEDRTALEHFKEVVQSFPADLSSLKITDRALIDEAKWWYNELSEEEKLNEEVVALYETLKKAEAIVVNFENEEIERAFKRISGIIIGSVVGGIVLVVGGGFGLWFLFRKREF